MRNLLIAREIFDSVRCHYPKLTRPNSGTIYERAHGVGDVTRFFEPEASENDRYGEDISFCRRWTACGGEIWACADEMVTHTGKVAFTGRLRDHLDYHQGIAL